MSLLEMSFSATILILAIVILRALFLHKLPKKTFLVLWGVALCRLLIPYSIPSRLSIYRLVNLLRSQLYKADMTLTKVPKAFGGTTMVGTVLPTLPETKAISMSPFFMLWLIGFLACALFFLVTHLRCRTEYRTALPVENELLEYWWQQNSIRRKIQIKQLDTIAAPLTYGIIKPVILLPKKTDWTKEDQLYYILTHEFVHIQRFDTLRKLILATALCVHWFNPFVWVMYILTNRDIELSCDETVVRTYGENMKSSYALTLIGLEEKKSRLTPLVNNFSKNAIEERIVSIMKMKKTSMIGMILALSLIVGTITVFATNTSTTDEGKSVENGPIAIADGTVYVDGTVYENISESKEKMFAIYEQYGLTYKTSTDQLFYKGELVRYFEDYYPVGDDAMVGRDHFDEQGVIDVHGVRDLSNLTVNADGSTDLGGKLVGVEPYSEEEFKARNLDEIKPTSLRETSVAYSSESQSIEEKELDSQSSGTSIAYSSDEVSPDDMAKTYAIYEPFGLTYNKKDNSLYYDGKLVRYFIDIISSNGEDFSGGYFKGSMLQYNSLDAKGDIDVYAVRDYDKTDSNGGGRLIDVKAYSQEEFDQRTKEEY